MKYRLFLTGSIVAAGFLGAVAADTTSDWGYAGATGPDNWGTLSQAYRTCATGSLQSPIDIEGTDPVIMHTLEPQYRVTDLDLVNTGKTLRQSYGRDSYLNVGDKRFTLQGFELRSPSEHTVMGQSFPMEIQLMHTSDKGETAIVSVLVEEGAENAAAAEFWQYLPLLNGQSFRSADIKINARDLMPFSLSYYRYMGSLTTPPCTEGVHWYVLKTPITLSKEQIDAAYGIMGRSARPVQPRFHRMILDTK
ncbi:carbonic anhydrase [Kordiimonas sediminis]|uniref:Carbonic anhydrase n=1 Tax=Kordiimonas sediminis TaxID=1735581 RepID=A0A919ANZ4_9PROT|nr:carbonic anhydrase family protein [Kordiimonas sediminis]GHF16419.1 carbonic anhydrase [Kordiimonas sediminis]